jgi:hypothetical protein
MGIDPIAFSLTIIHIGVSRGNFGCFWFVASWATIYQATEIGRQEALLGSGSSGKGRTKYALTW